MLGYAGNVVSGAITIPGIGNPPRTAAVLAGAGQLIDTDGLAVAPFSGLTVTPI